MTMAQQHFQSPRVARERSLPALIRRLCIATCLSMAATAAQAAPVDLSNQSLDAITATSPVRSRVDLEAGQRTTTERPTLDGRDGARTDEVADGTGIIADGSSVTGEFVDEVALTDGAQRDVRAANVVNAVISDSASGTNVFSAEGGDGSDSADGFAVTQSTVVEQKGARRARVGRYSVADGASSRTIEESGSSYSLGERRSEIRSVDRFGTTSVRETEFHASVPALTIGDLVFDVSQPPALPDIRIPLVKVGDTEYLSVVLESPELRLGDIVWSDERGVELQSARLIFPRIQVEIAGEETKNTGPRSISIGPVTLLDVENPVDDLGAVGFAAYGSGEIETTAGRLSLGTEINLRRILGAAIQDLETLQIPGTEVNFDSLLDRLLPVFELELSTELDPFGDLAGTFGKDEFGNDSDPETYCFPANSTTCDLISNSVDVTSSEHSSSETSSDVESHGSGHSRSETTSQRAAVEVRDAEARIVVLGESSASEERYHIVLVAEGSQNGMRILNGVNASNSITANGVNVIADRVTERVPSEGASSAYSQVNHITQIGGL